MELKRKVVHNCDNEKDYFRSGIRYLGFLDNGKISKMIYDSTSPGRVASSSDAEVMRKLLKGTVKGVCRDLARADNVLLDYFGIKSWTIVYANHEICVTSSLASERAYGEDEERIWLFNNGKVSSSTTNKYSLQRKSQAENLEL